MAEPTRTNLPSGCLAMSPYSAFTPPTDSNRNVGRAAGGEGGIQRGEQVAALERIEVQWPPAIGTADAPLECRL